MSLRATTSALRPLSRVSARAVRHTAANVSKPKQQQRRLITIRSNPEPVQSPNAGIKFGLSTTAAIVVVAGIVFKYGESKNKHAKGSSCSACKVHEADCFLLGQAASTTLTKPKKRNSPRFLRR